LQQKYGMARSIRIEYAGANYYVMARGNRREAIFFDDDWVAGVCVGVDEQSQWPSGFRA